MKINTYNISGAPRSWRVLVGLTIKKIDHQMTYLEGTEGEHKSPEYLKIHPRGTVPALEMGDLVVRDSIAILAWLDRQFPPNPLFGKTADEAALIWQTTMECNDYLRGAGQAFLYPILVENANPDVGSKHMESLKRAGDLMHRECTELNSRLKSTSFLCGETPSAAEAVSFPELRLIQRALERKGDVMEKMGFGDVARLYPDLFRWMKAVGEIEGMGKTLPRHW